MTDRTYTDRDLKLIETNTRLIEKQIKEITEKRKEEEEFNKKHNITLIIKKCFKCGYTDEKGIYHNYNYYYDENNPHKCKYDIRDEMFNI